MYLNLDLLYNIYKYKYKYITTNLLKSVSISKVLGYELKFYYNKNTSLYLPLLAYNKQMEQMKNNKLNK